MSSQRFRTDPSTLQSDRFEPESGDFADEPAWNDHKIAFALEHCAGLDVLDIGCVQHNPENYRSRFWVHRALREKAASLTGIDLSAPGVAFLKERGFNVVQADAQSFELDEDFDVIFAGDIIEHLEDLHGFLESCKRHLRVGGKLLISTPNPWYWRFVAQAMLRKEVNSNPEHTCWFDPRTFRQLLARHGMILREVRYGSRYMRDRLLPLPRGIKHTSWHAVATMAPG